MKTIKHILLTVAIIGGLILALEFQGVAFTVMLAVSLFSMLLLGSIEHTLRRILEELERRP